MQRDDENVKIFGPSFEEYSTRYPHYKMERDENGVVLLTAHTDGQELVWGAVPHEELQFVFGDLGADPDNKLIIFTAAGDEFINRENLGGGGPTARWWGQVQYRTRRMLTNMLDIEAPIIAAVNGPNSVHPEIAMLCDIVLASDTAWFQDAPHFNSGLVPGDGLQTVMPMLMGLNRARYFLLTGQKISAQEALNLGLVNEVLPREQLLERAYELADHILQRPPLTVRFTKAAILQQVRRQILDDTGYGIMAEGLAAVDYWPDRLS